ncbi:hypothetical protein TNCV_2699721 [Trichonephila clavipes]|nr:hypothetical protein TNCV_2699721 [Trichonephila clavipes]
MNDASFSRRDSVGSLVDWSMITVVQLGYAHSSRDDLVSELQVGNPDITFPLRYVDTMDGVAIFFLEEQMFAAV